MDRDATFAFLHRLADISAEAILPHFRQNVAIEDKGAGGRFDPVTAADRAGEEAMRRLIGEAYPEHGIIGEEFGRERADAAHVWVLDPIDGTRSFMAGLPLWGTLIGLLSDGAARAGMMHQPYTGERYLGDGAEAHLVERGATRRLRTRPCKALADATLMTTSPSLFSTEEQPAYDRIEAAVRLARYGADCYAYCQLAAGHVDLVVEAGLAPYDIVALIPIVEGAGGVITTWDGRPAQSGGRIVAAGDRSLHGQALDLLDAG